MPSPFVENFAHQLFLSTQGNGKSQISIQDTLFQLTSLHIAESNNASDTDALNSALTAQLTVALYAEALDAFLAQATQVEAEAEWWADVERSTLNVARYLVETTPARLLSLCHTILRALHNNHLPLSLDTLSPSSLRRLFPSPSALRPNALATALFPHLEQHPLSLSHTTAFSTCTTSLQPSVNHTFSSCISTALGLGRSLISLPIDLARQECTHTRKKLEKIRDERAETLGWLAQLRTPLTEIVEPSHLYTISQDRPYLDQLTAFISSMNSIVSFSPPISETATISPTIQLQALAVHLSTLHAAHTQLLISQRLFRPSALVRLWPKLVLFPPLALLLLKSLYTQRTTLFHVVEDARETTISFVRSWLIEPLKEVIKTVRAGGEPGVLVTKEGVLADLDSLERMALSLAQDALHYTSSQLSALASQVRLGDLTPIQRLYEADIEHPLKNAISGNLLRNIFVQAQKAKVDLDHALSGIDRLLKSQELTFAFVGVAPAFAVVYALASGVSRLLGGVKGHGKYGGSKRRRGVLGVVRRIERLLAQPSSSAPSSSSSSVPSPLPPLHTGLLLLSTTRLRAYALASLPPQSFLQTGFLEDVADLEEPELGKEEKARVVDRMWRCWGQGILGWGKVGTR